VQAVCLGLALNGYFAVRVVQDAKKRNMSPRAARVFGTMTLLTSFIGVAAYMFYEIRRGPKAYAGAPRAGKSPGPAILLVEMLLAALIIGVIYFVVTKAIFLQTP
jgi:hypothetical protein